MGSETTLKLPVIDCNGLDLQAKNQKWEEVKSQVFKAFKEYGAFEVVLDEVPLELCKSLVGFVKELFDLPYETKIKNKCEIPFFGYLEKDPGRRALYESIAFDEPQILENVETQEKILCPEGPSFSKVVHAFSEKLAELEKIFRAMLVESLGVEKYVDEVVDISSYILRVIKYRLPEADEAPLGIIPHTDSGFLTVLYQDEIQGLEIQTKDGKNWIKASPNSIVVVLGDCLHAWSNGRMDPTFHRVTIRGNEERYSTALFSRPKTGYMVTAPEELVDEEHPLLFKPFCVIKFLEYFYYNAEARKHVNALKAYCGV